MSIARLSRLPAAVLGLTLGWLDLPDAAIAARSCKAWLSAAAQQGRSTAGVICLAPKRQAAAHAREPESEPGVHAERTRARLELILSSVWRRHIGELCMPWDAALAERADLDWLPRIAAAMPQLARLTLTISAGLLPLDRLKLPAQLNELRLQIVMSNAEQRAYRNRSNDQSPSDVCLELQQHITAVLSLVAGSAPQLRALTLHVGSRNVCFSLWPGACDVILRLKQLERLYVLLIPSFALSNPVLSVLFTRFVCELPRLRTLMPHSAEWHFQQSWRCCPQENTIGAPTWTAETIGLLTAAPRDQCALEYVGTFDRSVTEDQYEELRCHIPTLKQPLGA